MWSDYTPAYHNEVVWTLKQKLEEQPSTNIPTNDLVKLAEFFLKNNLFEFNGKVKQQISGTAIGPKFAPPYACISIHKTDWFSQDPRSKTIYLIYLDALYWRYLFYIDAWRSRTWKVYGENEHIST